MRRLAILVATVAMLTIAPAASAAPPEDRVLIIDFSGDVDCDGASLTFHTTGWVNGPFDASHPTNYHLKWVYSNADGESWTYIDTGNIRYFERDGVVYQFVVGSVDQRGTGQLQLDRSLGAQHGDQRSVESRSRPWIRR